jgi:hypothetical protein
MFVRDLAAGDAEADVCDDAAADVLPEKEEEEVAVDGLDWFEDGLRLASSAGDIALLAFDPFILSC